MRLLCVTHHYPVPPDGGGAMRVHGLLRALAQRHEVRLVATARAQTGAREREQLRAMGIACDDFPPTPGAGGGARLWLRALARRSPPWVLARESPRLCARACALAADTDAVVLLDDFAGAYAASLRAAGARTIVADKHLVMGADHAQPHGPGLRPRAVRAVGARLTRSFERRYLRDVDAAVVTSDEDAERMARFHGRRPDAVVASAVDISPAAPEGDPRRVAWVGSLDGRPIVEGLVRFVRSGWAPLGRAGFELLIAGRDPPPELRALESSPGVRLLGFVEDLDALLADAGAAVVPLWAGQGVKLKTLTLLGAGLPTAATPTALEGIPAVDGRHCIVADDPASLAAGLERIAGDRALAAELGESGRRLVAERFSWEAVGPRFVDVVERASGASTR